MHMDDYNVPRKELSFFVSLVRSTEANGAAEYHMFQRPNRFLYHNALRLILIS